MNAAPENIPIRFTYDGKTYHGLPSECCDLTLKQDDYLCDRDKAYSAIRCQLDDRMHITVEMSGDVAFGEIEYRVTFENKGAAPSGVLADICQLDTCFEGNAPVLRGIYGDLGKWYEPYEKDLVKEEAFFRSDNGRATHFVFPYFDLVHGGGGTMIALGWAGTWEASFKGRENAVSVTGKTGIGFEACLVPSETVRSGIVVMLPYQGRDEWNACNLWREWFLTCNCPKADKTGRDLKPFSSVFFANDTGLPNSDGSISERYYTWKPTLDRLVKEDVVADFRWFDAGWYCDPAGNSVPTDWWGTVGTWEPDREKWPGDTMRACNDACHALGMKVLTWFEPERVTNVEDLAKNYGYKPEWGIVHGPVITNNIGDPECKKWTCDRILRMMDENNVDMYREDNNSDPAFAWAELDRRDNERLGLPRRGINENKCINGHYELWHEITTHGKSRDKCAFVDSCASGGGRNDILSLRYGVPMMRSDFDRTTSSMRLSQTTTFCRWVPFHGSNTKETETQLEPSKGAGSSPYVARASYLPIYNYGEAFTHNPALDYDLMRRNLNEWKSIRHLLIRDFYVLTPWHQNKDRTGWTALAYDAPDLGESVLMAFRQEDCESPTLNVRLPFARPSSVYRAVDADTGKENCFTGKELGQGITLTLNEKKTSLLWRIKRI